MTGADGVDDAAGAVVGLAVADGDGWCAAMFVGDSAAGAVPPQAQSAKASSEGLSRRERRISAGKL